MGSVTAAAAADFSVLLLARAAQGLGALLTAPVAEKHADRVDRRWFLVTGLLGTAAGTYWPAHVGAGTPWWFFLAPLAVVGAGIGAVESPADGVIDAGTPEDAA